MTKAALVSEGLDKAAHRAHTLGILCLIHRCPEVLTLTQRTVLLLEGHLGTSQVPDPCLPHVSLSLPSLWWKGLGTAVAQRRVTGPPGNSDANQSHV